ncbi:MAG: hypothetical protein ABFC63_04135 [Thermoguttaceae bacterium]
MTKTESKAKLAQVKIALAEKCERRAAVAGSAAKKNTFKWQAGRFRRQAADLTRS